MKNFSSAKKPRQIMIEATDRACKIGAAIPDNVALGGSNVKSTDVDDFLSGCRPGDEDNAFADNFWICASAELDKNLPRRARCSGHSFE